jgi:hypothetical protein
MAATNKSEPHRRDRRVVMVSFPHRVRNPNFLPAAPSPWGI